MLCSNLDRLYASSIEKRNTYIDDPQQFLCDACSDTNEIGSSTAVVLTLDQDKPNLKTYNLGDSGYMLLRKSGFDLIEIYKTKEQ